MEFVRVSEPSANLGMIDTQCQATENGEADASISAERQRRWLRIGCWAGGLFVLCAVVSVLFHRQWIQWRLEQRGWEIDFSFNDRGMKQLPDFAKPWFAENTSAHLSEFPLTVNDLHLLSQMPPLLTLSLHRTDISEPTLAAIGQFDTLGLIEISDSQYDDQGMSHLGKLSKLRLLEFVHTELTATALQGISSCRALTVLRMDEVQIADEDLVHLSKCPQLQALSITNVAVGDLAVEHISKITSLRQLSLHSKRITDAGCRHLSRLTNLDHLDLCGCTLTDQGVREITSAHRNLTSLWLESPHITDAVLTDIAGLPRLESLGLLNVSITPERFRELKKLPLLTWLRFSHDKVGAIRSEDWEELSRANPELTVNAVKHWNGMTFKR